MNNEGPVLHIAASLITGVVATTVAAPFDFVKTRVMSEGASSTNIVSILKKEGIFVLFRGWLPAYLRLGPHALICFPLFEQIRSIAGLSYL